MKRVIIICEGQTEREFCEKLLAHYLFQESIHIQAPLIKKSRGGIVQWDVLKKEIENHLSEPNVIVSTLIDYYGLNSKLNFPKWEEAKSVIDKNARMDFLESSMADEINEVMKHRFIPYLQLHEFEGLLFNDIQIFYNQVPKDDLVGHEELIQTFTQFSNPEFINDNKDTSPSHRLSRIIKGYNKPLYGHYLAEAIGINKIRQKSPRFDNWVHKIIKI